MPAPAAHHQLDLIDLATIEPPLPLETLARQFELMLCESFV